MAQTFLTLIFDAFLDVFFTGLLTDFSTVRFTLFFVAVGLTLEADRFTDAAFFTDFLTEFRAGCLTALTAVFFVDFGADFTAATAGLATLFFTDFLADFFAGFAAPLDLLAAGPPPKAAAQPSVYFSFGPTRRIVIVSIT